MAGRGCSGSKRTMRISTPLLEMFTQFYREPVVVQRYVPESAQGATSGSSSSMVSPSGGSTACPAAGEARSKHACRRTPRSPWSSRPRDLAICDSIGPELKAAGGLSSAGIDVIGDYLTEINVTSPTGIQELKRFGGADTAALIWDVIERQAQGP